MGSRFIACICVIALSLAFFLGFHLGQRYDQPQPVVVTAHPTVKQADGSLVLARQPGALKPQQQVAAGNAVVDVVKLTVRPKPYVPTTPPSASVPDSLSLAPTAAIPATCSCAPITVDMSLVRDKTGAEEVIASTPDGQIVGGIQAPVLPPLRKPEHPWAAGLSYGAGGLSGTLGVAVQRELGPFVIGGEVLAVNGALAGRLQAMIRF